MGLPIPVFQVVRDENGSRIKVQGISVIRINAIDTDKVDKSEFS
jgi:hypothetical protein